MLLKTDKIAALLSVSGGDAEDQVSIIPVPDMEQLKKGDQASIDLRLGRWFLTLRQSSTPSIELYKEDDEPAKEARDTKSRYVPFEKKFVLHPGRFVLGITLEWIKLPANIAGHVTGKSSLGRRGLIIETAAGIHPGFSGCLTLELANVGEVPLEISPGMPICQVFLHETTPSNNIRASVFNGRRRPIWNKLIADQTLTMLRKE